MNYVKKIIQLMLTLCICASVFAETKTPAFPEAQGFGAFTKGGRGGEVFIVTTTEDYDVDEPVIKGSFREAVEADMPRTVVFEVSGIIELKRNLKIENPYITIAGQTAPGDGICLKDYAFLVCADESIVRYLRVRLGDVHKSESDAIEIGQVVDNTGAESDSPNSNVIVDHCSAGWATDEVFTIGTERGTVQWCIISECLYKSYHPKGAHSMGSIIRGSYGGISILNNIYVHNNSRNPKLGNTEVSPGAVFDVRNNVIYNWGSTPGYSNADEHTRINLVGNFYKPGPSTRSSHEIAYRVSSPLNIMHVADNFHTNNAEAARDNWLLIHSTSGEINKRSTPFPYPPMERKTGVQTYEAVLNGAGAVLPARDPVDRRIINEIRTGTGAIINSQQDVGGWPVYKSTKVPADKDRDGMADEWESAHGLNARNRDDHKDDPDNDGYTNIEEYINGSDPNVATASLQDYAEYKAALDELEVLNVQGYADAKAYEAARLEALANQPEPEVEVSFSKLPDEKVKELTVLLNDSVEMKMNLVEAGTFTMGSPENEPGRGADETEHEVTISKAYYLAVTELTNEQFGEVMDSHEKRDNNPVEISMFDALKYTEVLSRHSGYTFRLPTEAEWEYACRAGTTTPNFTGKNITRKHANYNTREPGLETGTNEVAQTLANPWGVYDMPGNLMEWCSDILSDYPPGPVTDPVGPSMDRAKGITMASRRVLRGGRSSSSWEYVRSASRYAYKPKVKNGVRFVLEVEKAEQQIAFPGAEGYGRFAKGGRGGDVYVVTNLDDDGAGSLRYGIENMNGPRTIVFAVSGTIELKSAINIEKSYLTIAGQTAAGDGICLKDYGLKFNDVHDIIMRYIRIRYGDLNKPDVTGDDCITTNDVSDIIFDHISVGWGIDAIHDLRRGGNFTLQWSIYGETLHNSLHYEGVAHSKLGSLREVTNNISLHHNLFHSTFDRHPSLGGGVPDAIIDFRNNLIYNSGGQTNLGKSQTNVINNYYKQGPVTKTDKFPMRIKTKEIGENFPAGFTSGNVYSWSQPYTNDNFSAIQYTNSGKYLSTTREAWELPAELVFGNDRPVTQSASDAYDLVLLHAGASKSRDACDERIINEVKDGTGFVPDSQDEVGGWPTLNSLPTPQDTDQDGMPDTWETQKELNPTDPGDRDNDGFTNLEEYLNSLVDIAYNNGKNK